MMEQMTINDLKTGMHVVTRDGTERMVLKDTMFRDKDILIAVHEDTNSGAWISLNRYRANLTHEKDSAFDIIKVYQPVYEYTTLEYKFDSCPCAELSSMLFAEETMTKAEAEEKFGIRIVD